MRHQDLSTFQERLLIIGHRTKTHSNDSSDQKKSKHVELRGKDKATDKIIITVTRELLVSLNIFQLITLV